MWYLIVITIIATFTDAQTNNTNASEPTVDQMVVDYLESAMNHQLNITTKYCTWNVTLIVHLINETDPDFFFSSQNVQLLPQFLPTYTIKQLPQVLLDFYGMNFSNSTDLSCGDNTLLTDTNIDVCIGPLIHSKRDNPLKHEKERPLYLKNLTGLDYYMNVSLSDCGLACSSAHEIFGLTDNEQKVVDIFKIIGLVVCFIAMVTLAITQYIELKKTGDTFRQFRDRPLLQMIPFVLTFAGFGVVCSMAMGEIVGKEKVVCSHNINYETYNEEELEFSFYNPFIGQNASCTMQGLFFYTCVQLYEYYTVLLSFVIYRQVSAPIKPLWAIKDRWWHISVCLLVLIFDIIGISMNTFAGVWPMSVCFPGFLDKYELLWLVCIPFHICLFLSIIFISASAYLLRRTLIQQKQVMAKGGTDRMQDLVKRYMFYSIGELSALGLLNATGIAFFVEIDRMEQQMKDIIQCEIEKVLLDPNMLCDRQHSMSIFWFMSWIIISMLAIFSQIILTCHADNRNRVKKIAEMTGLGSKEKSKTGQSSPKNSINSPSKQNIELVSTTDNLGNRIQPIDSPQSSDMDQPNDFTFDQK